MRAVLAKPGTPVTAARRRLRGQAGVVETRRRLARAVAELLRRADVPANGAVTPVARAAARVASGVSAAAT